MRHSRWIGFGVGVVALALAPLAAGAGENCFSVMVGPGASRDGAVLFAHNEDDRPPQIVNWITVPHRVHAPGEVVRLKDGATLPQVGETAGMIWLQMPQQEFSDAYMNEYGVTIASNACWSRVNDANLTDGGIGYWLRRLMAQRAHSAREAVEIGGRLIERFGYHSSGRTYCIAGPREAWMMAVVRGRLWVAERIPDNAVAVLANRYTIGEIDLADTANFLGNPDVVSYAEKRGWYDPKRDGDFNFRNAYSAPSSRYSIANIARQWRGVSVLSGKKWYPGADLPFAFRPAHAVDVRDLMSLLRDHFEGTQFETPATFNHGDPHKNFVKRICSQTTQYGFVAQLRSSLPPAVGAVLWIAPRRPCVQPFVPVYCGIESFPHGFARLPWRRAIATQFTRDPARFEPTPALAYWSFVRRAARIDAEYGRVIPRVRLRRDALQDAVTRAEAAFEPKALELLEKNPAKGRAALTRFTARWLNRLRRYNLTGKASAGASPRRSFQIRR
ncbi:MAG: hypothetical protein GXP48_10480 [Acidobacteria bacterium]|nr:hypothetical protein [Acidobacteriota bacterium]